MPIDEPAARPAPPRRHLVNAGTIWQGVRLRVTGWFRPTHPRFALHLFLLTLAVGLLLGMASLAMTGIVQLSRRGSVAIDAQSAGPNGLLPTPMTLGKDALSAAGVQHPSSMTIEDSSKTAPDPASNAAMAVDPDMAGVSIGSATADPSATPADDPLDPPQVAALDPAAPLPAPGEPVRIGPQAEVVLSVQIDTQGNPVQISVQHSSGSPAIDDAALLEVHNRHFPPSLRDGEPVPATLSVPVRVPQQDH